MAIVAAAGEVAGMGAVRAVMLVAPIISSGRPNSLSKRGTAAVAAGTKGSSSRGGGRGARRG